MKNNILEHEKLVTERINKSFGVESNGINKAIDSSLESDDKSLDIDIEKAHNIGDEKVYQGVTYYVSGFNSKNIPLWRKKKGQTSGSLNSNIKKKEEVKETKEGKDDIKDNSKGNKKNSLNIPTPLNNNMTLNEYLGEYSSPFGYDVAAQKGRMKTARAQKQWLKFQEERAQKYYKIRAKKIAEYKAIYVEQPVDRVKELINTANGNEDNESTLAARRICEKRHINWNIKKSILESNDNSLDELQKAHNIGDEKMYQGITYYVSGFNSKHVPLWKKKKGQVSGSSNVNVKTNKEEDKSKEEKKMLKNNSPKDESKEKKTNKDKSKESYKNYITRREDIKKKVSEAQKEMNDLGDREDSDGYSEGYKIFGNVSDFDYDIDTRKLSVYATDKAYGDNPPDRKTVISKKDFDDYDRTSGYTRNYRGEREPFCSNERGAVSVYMMLKKKGVDVDKNKIKLITHFD
jgi:hypothetical protein